MQRPLTVHRANQYLMRTQLMESLHYKRPAGRKSCNFFKNLKVSAFDKLQTRMRLLNLMCLFNLVVTYLPHVM